MVYLNIHVTTVVIFISVLHKYSDRIIIENEHSFFDTLKIRVPNIITVHERAIEAEINMRYYEDG